MLDTVSTAPAPENVESSSAEGLSKNARKKVARAERLAASKLERRAREKEARKEKKRVRAEKRAAGELDEEEKEEGTRKKTRHLNSDFHGRVVIDLGFDDKMLDKEIKSLCSQLAYTYSANRNASYPFTLLFTSLNARTLDKMEGTNNAAYKRWSKTEFWSQGYEHLWSDTQTEKCSSDGNASTGASNDAETENYDAAHNVEVKGKVIYLTADAEDELEELKEGETYIIGGICDHNRYKNLCLNKAQESGVRAARLPIGRYLASMPTRKVLTVNQVFDILVQWVFTRDWEQSLVTVMPKRKFQSNGQDTEGISEAHYEAEPLQTVDS